MTETILALDAPTADVLIRPVRLSDIDSLHRHCWPDRAPDTIYRFINRIRNTAVNGRGLGAVVADDQNTAIGYGQFMMWPRCGEISDLVIASQYRCKGYGTALIQYLVRAAREMQADCVDIGAAYSNPRAMALYRRLGFRDSYEQVMNLGAGDEDVLYLRIKFPR